MPWAGGSNVARPKGREHDRQGSPLQVAVEEARVVAVSVALVDVEIIQLTVAFQISSL
jgi:hypothetical protein